MKKANEKKDKTGIGSIAKTIQILKEKQMLIENKEIEQGENRPEKENVKEVKEDEPRNYF